MYAIKCNLTEVAKITNPSKQSKIMIIIIIIIKISIQAYECFYCLPQVYTHPPTRPQYALS